MGLFFRNLRSELGGEPFPYVWVPEWHKTDHGMHAHFAVGRYVKRSCIEQAWGRGFVHIKLLGDLPVGSTAVVEARVAAGYISKYVGKAFDDHRIDGLHRYEVGQGFKPEKRVVKARMLEEAYQLASEVMGGPPNVVSHSAGWTAWTGPTAVAMTWAS